MKIIHFYNSLYLGGVDSFLVELANTMSLTEDVSICTLRPAKNGGVRNLLNSDVKYFTIGDTTLSLTNKIKDTFSIARFLYQHKFDIVHIHGAFNFYILSILLFHKRIKFFYTIHSDAIMENGPMGRRLLALKKIFFKRKLITPITISTASQQSFHDLYKCDSVLIHNGILPPKNISQDNPTKDFKLTENTLIFTHVGRICEAKNQLILCKCFDRLIKENKDIVLLIIGPREDEAIYNDIQPYFSNRIIYLGPKNNVLDYLTHSDAMCLPSIYEGLPIVLLEAISVGCVPICSPVGGIPDVINNKKNGFLSQNSSEHSYYLAIKTYLNQTKDTLIRMKDDCIKTSSRFTIGCTVDKHIRTYKGDYKQLGYLK